jgi:transcription factor SOX7/8/10/18 (SOX group E/F)
MSNTEVSSLLGKMWKEVPAEVKLQYKQRATVAQEEFKRQHPDYTYRNARKKRALTELLAKSPQGLPAGNFPVEQSFGNQNPYQFMQMYAQNQMPQGIPIQYGQMPGQLGNPVIPGGGPIPGMEYAPFSGGWARHGTLPGK